MLRLGNVTITLNDTALIKDLSLDIAAGQIVTLMGKSGSGKSSLLAFIGGDLDEAFSANGSVLLNAENILALSPEKRRIGRLFQDDLLFPHMTVGENLLFALPNALGHERRSMMLMALQRAELEGFENRAPHTLSGGQRARVSLMRTLLAKPQAILLDEPFSKLDQNLRQTIRQYTFAHIRARNIPAFLVTHDPADVPPAGLVLELTPSGEVKHA